MPIRFRCGCGSKILVPDKFAGRSVRCPACQQSTVVPNAPEVPADEQVTPQRKASATNRETTITHSQPSESGAVADAEPIRRARMLTERSHVGDGLLPTKRPQRDSLPSDRPKLDQQPVEPLAADKQPADQQEATRQRTERQLAEQQRTERQEASRQAGTRPQTENRQAEKMDAAKPPSKPFAQRPSPSTPLANADSGVVDRLSDPGGPAQRLVADASGKVTDLAKAASDRLGTPSLANSAIKDHEPAAARRVAQPTATGRFGPGATSPVSDRLSDSVDPRIPPGVAANAATGTSEAVQGERITPASIAGLDLSGGRAVPTTPTSHRAVQRDQGPAQAYSASESNAIPIGPLSTTINPPRGGRFSSLVSFFFSNSDPSVRPPQLRIVDERLTASAKSLAWGLAAISLVGFLPALWAIATQVEAADRYGVGRWVHLMLLLTMLQWAYAIYLGQLPDSSSLWIVTIFTLGLATIYAALLGITLIARPDTDWLADLDLVEPLRGRRATGWCFIMLCLVSLMSYLCGRASLRWSDTGRAYSAK